MSRTESTMMMMMQIVSLWSDVLQASSCKLPGWPKGWQLQCLRDSRCWGHLKIKIKCSRDIERLKYSEDLINKQVQYSEDLKSGRI